MRPSIYIKTFISLFKGQSQIARYNLPRRKLYKLNLIIRSNSAWCIGKYYQLIFEAQSVLYCGQRYKFVKTLFKKLWINPLKIIIVEICELQ